MSRFLTQQIAADATDDVTPMLINMLKRKQLLRNGEPVKELQCSMVILNPAVTPSNVPKMDVQTVMEYGLLYERFVGDKQGCVTDFSHYAMRKSHLVWRTGMSCRKVITQYPHLLLPHDCKYFGGIIHEGIIVAVSGFDQDQDEMIATCVAAQCLCRARFALRAWQHDFPDDRFFT